jgi:hypothetical protein
MAPVVVDAVARMHAMDRECPMIVEAFAGLASPSVSRGNDSPRAANSRHVWAEGGVAERRLAAGWRPDVGPYPSLPPDIIRRSSGPT